MSGHYDAQGIWMHAEDDPIPVAPLGFSSMLNRLAVSVSDALLPLKRLGLQATTAILEARQSAADAGAAAARAEAAALMTDPLTAPLDGGTAALIKSAISDTRAALLEDFALRTAHVYSATAGDQTIALQSFLDALQDGDEALLRGGEIAFSTITIEHDNLSVRLAPGTTLSKLDAATDGIRITGAGVTLAGGAVTAPAIFDGVNTAPTYAVIRITGAGARIDGVTLTNVPKVGIYFDDADDGQVTDCHIIGNYPPANYTGTETGHFGIALNPGTSGRSGRHRITGNLIQSCVQGIFVGNYGPAGVGAYGTVISANIFDGCHNHGVYNAGGLDAIAVSGNTFTRCSLPIALTGPGHAITGNTMFTHSSGNNLDVMGISLREPVGCVVTGNTLQGDATAGAVIIDLANYVAGSTVMRNNIVSANTVLITGGASTAIRVGRGTQTTICTNNIVANNVVSSIGNPGVGVITVAPSAGASAYGNKVTGNSITVQGESHGIYLANVQHATVQGNTIRFHFNAATPKVLAGVQLSACSRTIISGNDFYNGTGFGTLVSIRGIWETAGCSTNKFGPNAHDGTGAAGYVSIASVAGSNCFVDENGTGSPAGAFFAAAGSRWARLDGAAATSLYIKESDSTSAVGWAAK